MQVLVVVVAVCILAGLPQPALQRKSGDAAGPHVVHGVLEVQAMEMESGEGEERSGGERLRPSAPSAGPRRDPVADLRVALLNIELVQGHRAEELPARAGHGPGRMVAAAPIVATLHPYCCGSGRVVSRRAGVPTGDVLIGERGQQPG